MPAFLPSHWCYLCAPPLVDTTVGSRVLVRSDRAAVSGWLLNERHGRTTWRQLSTCPCATGRSRDPGNARQPRPPEVVGVELAQMAETAGTCSRASSPTRRAGNKLDVPMLWKV